MRKLYDGLGYAGVSGRKGSIGTMSNEFTRKRPLQKDTSVLQIKRIPMSFAQERLWFLEQLEPGTSLYNVSLALRLTGPLVEEALRNALDAIVARHEVIRTTYAASEGTPVQVIHPPCPVDWAKIDLSTLAEERRDVDAQAYVVQEARRPFDLSSDLMLRARLFRLTPDDHILLLVMHHIATDGWSTDLLWHEFSVLYNAQVHSEEPKLPDLTIRYADYALWQREILQGSILERDLAYWRRQLEGVSRLSMPTDRTRGAEPDHHGASVSVNLPTSLVDQLKRLAREENATLFMVLLAVLMVMLRRYTGQDDICVGAPIAGRTRSDVEKLIGFFVNMLVFREDLSGEPSFRDFLRSVRSTCLEAYEHQELPFEALVAELQPARVRNQTPFFQVTLSLQHGDPRSPQFSRLTSERVPIPTTTSKFDLSVAARESTSGLFMSMTYSTALFDRETIQRALVHYELLLRSIAEDANQPISALPMLPATEKKRLLVEWNDTQRAYPKNRCIHELFEAQVARTPDKIAVVCGDESVSYRGLARRVERLAEQLRCCGVRRNVPVGIHLERSINLPVSILAVLKAGGAYVPFDMTVPRQRLIFMLEDAAVRCLITQRSLDIDLSTWKGERIVVDGTPPTEVGANEGSHTPERWLPDGIACIFYTSGSTGKPKGVMQTHRGVVNHLVGTYAMLGIQPDDVVLQIASPAFDMSLRDLIGPLIHGVRVVLLGERQIKNPAEIISTVQAQSITTILGTVPSLLSVLVDTVSAQGTQIPTLRLVATSGETHSRGLAQRMLATFGQQVNLYNCYGPTEATGVATIYRIANLPPGQSSIPIGHPLPNVSVYVLDRSLQPTGVGIPGDLYLAGPGVAEGYVNRPRLTAERFIRSPFDSDTILYKTGDLGRWLACGELEFLGRADRQIKLRGYRIELREIEAVLCKHPEVRQAVVEVYEPMPGEQRLAAYVVVSDATSGNLAAPLREHLRERLPRYMLPSQFIVLDELPLTPRGKLDHAALSLLARMQESPIKAFVGPETPIEMSIAKIWRNVLGVDRISIHDGFFDLGGHSLLAVRLIARIEKTFGISLPLAVLFDSPTIEALSQAVQERNPRLSRSTVVRLQKGDDGPPFFCVPPAASSVNHFAQLVRTLSSDIPFYGMQALGLEPDEVPQDRIEDMATRCVADMRAVQPNGPYFIGGRCLGAYIAFEMALQLLEIGEDVALLALLDPTGPPGMRRDLRYYVRRAGFFRRRKQLVRAVLRRVRWTLRQVQRLRVLRYLGSHHTRRIQRTYKAHMRAQKTYAPRVYAGAITFFASSQEYSPDDSRPLWRDLTSCGLELHLVPGSHRTMRQDPHLHTLVRELEGAIHEARQRTRTATRKEECNREKPPGQSGS